MAIVITNNVWLNNCTEKMVGWNSFVCITPLLHVLLCSLQSVTFHTDLGDIKIELFCEQVPKPCEVRCKCGLLCDSCQIFLVFVVIS